MTVPHMVNFCERLKAQVLISYEGSNEYVKLTLSNILTSICTFMVSITLPSLDDFGDESMTHYIRWA